VVPARELVRVPVPVRAVPVWALVSGSAWALESEQVRVPALVAAA